MAFRSRYPGLSAAEIMKRRGITRLVYFHCDHFEPWRFVPGRAADYALSVGDVEDYVRQTEGCDWARAATLFYKANINYMVDPSRDLWRGHPADPIGFAPPSAEADALSQAVLDALIGHGRELQVHIHHENITWNDRMRDADMRAHLDAPEQRIFDDARFELLVRLNLDLLARQGRIDPDAWFFVHGHWALNASDPHECTIVREIEILRRNGCLGDFTMPAGRPHVDPRLEEPYLARPVALPKGYDRPEAEPIAAAGAGRVPADRFLVWASEINHRFCSLDHYSGFVRERMADPALFGQANAELGFAHDSVLYVKTHAHMLQPAYWQAEGGAGPFPHVHPGIVAELTGLFEAASGAGIAVEFATVSQVFARLMAAAPAATRDLAAVYRLSEGNPMARVGCDVVHLSGAGEGIASAPAPLGPRPDAISDPAPATGPAPAGRSWPAVIDIAEPAAAIDLPRLAVAIDPVLVDRADVLVQLAGHVAAGRAALLGPDEAAGAESSDAGIAAYVDRATRIAALVEASGIDRQAPVVEIGCGQGLIPTLLAVRDRAAIGIDCDAAEIADARAIAAEAEAAGLLEIAPRFETGHFPEWGQSRNDLDHAVAIVTGLAAEAGLSGQAAFIRGLAAFEFAIVDLGRFLVPRAPGAEQARLIELFAQAGFEAPRLADIPGSDAAIAIFRHGRPRGLKGWTAKVLRSLGRREAA